MSPAGWRMLAVLVRDSDAEERRHPGSGGWVEAWDVFTEWAWAGEVPASLTGAVSSRTWAVLERLRLVEDHPERNLRGLVRPSARGREWAADPNRDWLKVCTVCHRSLAEPSHLGCVCPGGPR